MCVSIKGTFHSNTQCKYNMLFNELSDVKTEYDQYFDKVIIGVGIKGIITGVVIEQMF